MGKSENINIQPTDQLSRSERESAKSVLKQKLEKFSDTRIESRKDFRILQGILSKRFKALETEKERKEIFKLSKREFKQEIVALKFKEQLDKKLSIFNTFETTKTKLGRNHALSYV